MKLYSQKEYLRLRRELGQLLKIGREHERLDAETIAKQNGLENAKELDKLESGDHKNLWKYLQVARYYGMQIHLFMDFIDMNSNRKWRRRQAEESKFWFLQVWSGILQSQRQFNHYSREQLAEMTGIPVKRIKQMEENDENMAFSLDEACLLMAYCNKNLIPETMRME